MLDNNFKKRKFILVVIALLFGAFLLLFSVWQRNHLKHTRKVDCAESVSKIDCWTRELNRVIESDGLDSAFDLVDYWYQSDVDFAISCHSFSHVLGKQAYELFSVGKDFEVSEKTAYCSYGFYHGFMEALIVGSGDFEEAKRFCDYVDAKLSKMTPDVSLQCYHGMGHGWVNVHDKPEIWGRVDKIVQPALDLCSKVSSDKSQESRCATGVFNGVVLFMISGEYGLSVNKNNPMEICFNQPDEFKDACFISMNILLVDIFKGDFERSAREIEKIKDDTMAGHAMINLASVMSMSSGNTFEGQKLQVEMCRKVSARLRNYCFQGFAFGFMENGQPQKEYEKPLEFCGLDLLTEEESEACYEYIFSYLGQWYPEVKVNQICESLNTTLSKRCVEIYKKTFSLDE